MNSLDFVVVGIIILSGLFAFARGFVREVLSIAAWLGAAASVIYVYPLVLPVAQRYVGPSPTHDAVIACVTFIVALILLSIVAAMVSRRVKRSSLSALDRSLGLVFGLVRGVIVVTVLYFAASRFLPPDHKQWPQWAADAHTLPLIAAGSGEFERLAPQQLRDKAAAMNPQNMLNREVESAIRAYATPGARPPGGAATYTADDKRELDRLFQQLGSGPDAQGKIRQYLQEHPEAAQKFLNQSGQ